MTISTFDGLSSLVLVDVAAAVPMEHVLRMARLGNSKFRQTCRLKWVTGRMTNVTFECLVRASLAGREFVDAFCTQIIMKILHGKVTIDVGEFGSAERPHGDLRRAL